ncbi:carboxylesterase family protein [Penicillium sp. IBT 16267x]|nr:carboxylesterase family protein [Penicillium sp. IBT 16267x]
MQFICPILYTAKMNNKFSTDSTTTYLYAFNRPSSRHSWKIKASTVYADLSSESDIELACEMSGSWASFATYGDPSKANGSISGWSIAPKASSGVYNVQVIGGPDSGSKTIPNSSGSWEDLARRWAFWTSEEVFEQLGI